MNKGIIYFASNKVNSKVYVGQTVNSIKQRIRLHLESNSESYFKRALKKHGLEGFVFGSIEYPVKKLNDMEIYWIKILNTKSSSGYNLTIGGDGTRGHKFTKEQKIRTTKAIKKAWENKILREKQKNNIKNLWKDPVYRKNQTNRIKIGVNKPEFVANNKKSIKKLWEDKEYRKKCCKKFIFTSPEGKKYLVDNGFENFCIKNRLNFRSISRVLYNKYSNWKGWKVIYA